MSKPFDPSRPVQTRDGRPARIIATDVANLRPIVAVIADDTGFESVEKFYQGGIRVAGSVHPGDLINVPEKHVRWIIVSKGYGFETRAQAAAVVPETGSYSIVKVEWTEGEGLTDGDAA